MPTESFQFVLS